MARNEFQKTDRASIPLGALVPRRLFIFEHAAAANILDRDRTFFAATAIARWRGLWAGVAFFGFVYIYASPFVPTSLTEPLGLLWAFFSIPFFVQALRTGSIGHALLAFAATVIALMSRMGNIFTIPALMLWLVWCFGQALWEKVKIAACATVILLGALSANFVLSQVYGKGQHLTGSNVSYVLCGLTIGEDWSECAKRYAKEGGIVPSDEQSLIQLNFSLALEHFEKDPAVFFNRIFYIGQKFVEELPDRLWEGYTRALRNLHGFREGYDMGCPVRRCLFDGPTSRARRNSILVSLVDQYHCIGRAHLPRRWRPHTCGGLPHVDHVRFGGVRRTGGRHVSGAISRQIWRVDNRDRRLLVDRTSFL